jgi:hypothetical protein
MGSSLHSYKHSLSMRNFEIQKLVCVRKIKKANTNRIQQILIVGTALLRETPVRYALLLEAGRINCFVIRAENSLRTCNESNQTMPEATHHHSIHNHHASYQVLQSISLNGRLAARVCLAILAKHGLWKDLLLVVMTWTCTKFRTETGSQSMLLKVHPHNLTILSISHWVALLDPGLLVRFFSLLWRRSMAHRVYHGSISESDDEFTDQLQHHGPDLGRRVSLSPRVHQPRQSSGQ